MTAQKSYNFAEATAVTPISSHTYSAEFHDDWCIGTVPHGGFVTGVFLQVARAHFSTTLKSQNQPNTLALHLDFLRRTQTGPALFTVTDTKLGRQTSVIQIVLSQADRSEVVGSITNANLATETGVSFPTSWELRPPPPNIDLVRAAVDADANWGKQKDTPFGDFRKASAKLEFWYPRQGQTSRSTGDEWVRLATGEKWTDESIGFLCDMWPMPVEANIHPQNPYNLTSGPSKAVQAQLARFWYPTLLLNLEFKKTLPPDGAEWLFVRVDTKRITNGRMDIEVVILDEGGDVVALSQHVSLAVDSSRNVAERKTVSKI